MHYGASFLAYAIWVHKSATLKNWLMRVKGPIVHGGKFSQLYALLVIHGKT